MNNSKTENFVPLRRDWYQSGEAVVISYFVKAATQNTVKVIFENDKFQIEVALPDSKFFSQDVQLFQNIISKSSSYKILSTKIDVKLKKAEGFHWTSLEESKKAEKLSKALPLDNIDTKLPTYPSSSAKKHDWNKLEAEIKEKEKEEKPEGDAALSQLFQNIYIDGTDEVKRAMNKSFSESGGTCLSTDWRDIKNRTVEVKPPDGTEHRKWNN